MTALETQPNQPEQPVSHGHKWRQRLGRLGLIGTTVVGTLTGLAYDYDVLVHAADIASGNYSSSLAEGPPSGASGANAVIGNEYDPAKQARNDGKLRVAEWNLHNQPYQRAKDVVNLITSKRLDAFIGVEANVAGVKQITDLLPKGYYVLSVDTGATVAPNHAEVINMMVLDQKPEAINTASLGGSPRFKGKARMLGSLASSTWGKLTDPGQRQSFGLDIRKNAQANRAVIGASLTENIGGKPVNIYVAGTHLSYITNSPEHASQIERLNKFMYQHVDGSDIQVLCGDFNYPSPAGMHESFPNFEFDKTGQTMVDTSPDLLNDKQPIDYCLRQFFHSAGDYTASTKVFNKYATDHYAIMTTIKRKPNNQLNGFQSKASALAIN